MDLLTAIKRFRLNPLRDSVEPYLWPTSEIVPYFNEKIDELCEETFVLVDSETPQICQKIVGVVAANMAQGTNAATLKVVTAFDFMNLGKLYTMPVTDNIAITACSAQAVSTYCRYLVCADDDNAVTVQKGDDAETAAEAYLPLMTEGLTPIGMLLILTDATHTFTSGTNSLDDTGITATFESSTNSFDRDARIVRVNSAELANSPYPLSIKDKHWMNRNISGWKNYDPAIPDALVHGANTGAYLVWPPAKYPDQILLTVARRPLTPLDAGEPDTEIELPEQYVKRLYNGVAQLAFLKRDAEIFDPQKAADHGNKWLADIEAVKRDIIRSNMTNETNELPSGVLP